MLGFLNPPIIKGTLPTLLMVNFTTETAVFQRWFSKKNTAAPQDPWKTNKVPHRPGQFHGLKVASKDRISTSNVTGITLLDFLDANSICLQH